MRTRLLIALAAGLLFVAGCSDDSSSDDSATDTPVAEDPATDDSTEESADTSEADETGDDPSDAADPGDGTDDASSDSTEPDDESGGNPVTSGDGSRPGSFEFDPVGATEQVEAMVEEANSDGEVTAEEISGILEVIDVPERQASCEGDLLASLGVTDPTDPDQLSEAAASLTSEQLVELTVCMGGG